MSRPTVRKVDHVAGPSEWDDGYGRRWCSEIAANVANAERFRADAQMAAEDASRKNAEAMTPTDAEQEAADADRKAEQDKVFIREWNEATNNGHKAEQEAARKADILALHRASAAQEIHNAEIVAAGLDKPGDRKGHPPPPMLEAATRQDATEGAKMESIAEQLKKMQDKIDALEQEVASVRDNVNFLYSREE